MFLHEVLPKFHSRAVVGVRRVKHVAQVVISGEELGERPLIHRT